MSESKISIGVKLVTDLKDFIAGFRQAQETTAQFGEQVEKKATQPLNKLQGQLNSLKSAQKRAISPEEYAKIGNEIKRVQGEIDIFKGKTAQSGGIIENLIGTAKGLLPAFGFAAIGAAGAYAFKQIIASTDELTTSWEATMNGMKNGLNEFWRTLATGDFSNFVTNIREAIKAGREYIETIDDIEEKTRSLSIREAEAQEKIISLEEALKNKTLSKQERIKAGQERIQLEKDLAADRVKVAQEVFDNESMLTSQQTKLSKETLMNVMRDMDSETKVRAKTYNERLDQLKKLQDANTTVRGGMGISYVEQNADTDQIKNLKRLLEEATPATKLYAEQIRKTGTTTDEQLDKMVSSYEKLLGAQNSARGNIKKIITSVNSLLAGEEDTGQKLADKANNLDDQIKSYNDKLTSSKNLTVEETAAIGAKIEALKTLKKAYEDIASDPASFRTDKLQPMQTGRVTGKLQVSAPSNKKEVDVYNVRYSKNTQDLEGLGDYLYQNKEKVESLTEAWKEWNDQPSNIELLAGQFDSLGYSIGGAFGSFLTSIGEILNLIPVLIAQITALTTAQTTSSTAVVAAKQGEAMASGTAASQSVPFPLNIIALAVTMAAIVASFAKIPKFATGGIVPGSSFSGDKVLARVNSGEEILTASDPRHSRNRSAAQQGQADIQIINQAVVKGEDIYILMKKAERRISQRT